MILERHKFTLEEFHQMNFFDEDSRIELIDGEIIHMSPIGSLHAACLKRLLRLLEGLSNQAIVSAQDPLIVLDNELVPDVVLLSYRNDFYAGKAASSEDAHLVIEISDTTIDYDQKIKVPKYAKAGIPEVWIIDINESLIWVYRNSSNRGYLDIKAHHRNEAITLFSFPDITLTVNDVLGSAL